MLPELLRPEIEFELPYKKSDGFYKLLPNTNFIGGKNSLRNLAATKVEVGYIYLINIIDTTKYKIGVTSNPKRRLADISSVIPFELNVLSLNKINNPYVFEQDLINLFKTKLIKNEWFDLSIDDVKYIMITLHNQQVKESIYG